MSGGRRGSARRFGSGDADNGDEPRAERLAGLAPVAALDAELLILGSMPGAESLRRGQYYAYRFNRFWPLLFTYFGETFSEDYAVRTELVLRRKIALWDCVASCLRENSSLDARIRDASVNDVPRFLKEHPSVRHIVVNGRKSEQVFRKAFPGLSCTALPSTSPANAAWSFDRLLETWGEALNALPAK